MGNVSLNMNNYYQGYVNVPRESLANQMPNYSNIMQQEPEKKDGFFGKKTLIAIGLVLSTAVGMAVLGNKSANSMAKIGSQVDDWANNSKMYQGIADFCKKAKEGIVKFFKKSDTIQEIAETMQNNKATPKWDIARGYGQGFKSMFAMTPPDVIQTALKNKNPNEILEILQKILPDEQANKIIAYIKRESKLTNIEFSDILLDGISKKFNCKNKTDLLNVLLEMKSGKGNCGEAAKDFLDIVMDGTTKDGGLGNAQGAWWPVIWIDKLGKKIRGDKWRGFGRGNLGDSLLKYASVSDKLADTKLGAFTQKFTLELTDGVSNLVNDKSLMGFLMLGATVGFWKDVQDAKGVKQKTSTVTNDWLSMVANLGIAAPLAFGTTYGLATLSRMEGKTILSKCLKQVGKIFHIGLGKGTKYKTLNKVIGFGGGLGRFGLIMFALTPLFMKPVSKVLEKVLGKPYSPYDEANNQQQVGQQLTPEQIALYQKLLIAQAQAQAQGVSPANPFLQSRAI